LMRQFVVFAAGMALAAVPAFSQSAAQTPAAAAQANPPHAATAKPAASTPESRSAAALALSHEPTFDEGTAQRIKEAALSYSDLAVRGGWPTIPSDAKFAIGVADPSDDLLRQRLIISEDLAADKASGAFDETLAEAVKHFQVRHGLAEALQGQREHGEETGEHLGSAALPVAGRVGVEGAGSEFWDGDVWRGK